MGWEYWNPWLDVFLVNTLPTELHHQLDNMHFWYFQCIFFLQKRVLDEVIWSLGKWGRGCFQVMSEVEIICILYLNWLCLLIRWSFGLKFLNFNTGFLLTKLNETIYLGLVEWFPDIMCMCVCVHAPFINATHYIILTSA